MLGADRSLLASGRLDNQLSCWAAATALAETDPNDAIAVIVLNDHEEVGSASTTGAAGPFLQSVLSRLVAARGGSNDDLHRSFAASACISADNAHAVHPNYPERHEPDHRPIVNAGPAIKVNSNQRYATSAETAAVFQRACERAGVPWQVFVSRNNMPCGSTIGPVTATRLGIATVDVGVATALDALGSRTLRCRRSRLPRAGDVGVPPRHRRRLSVNRPWTGPRRRAAGVRPRGARSPI